MTNKILKILECYPVPLVDDLEEYNDKLKSVCVV